MRQDSIGSIPDFKVTNADGTQNIKDMSQGARVSMTKPEAASDKLRPWVENLNAAVEEWNEYKNAARQSFINEKLPHLGKYTEPDVRMPEFTGNGDGTYTVKPIEDKLWSPGKDVEIVYADESEFLPSVRRSITIFACLTGHSSARTMRAHMTGTAYGAEGVKRSLKRLPESTA